MRTLFIPTWLPSWTSDLCLLLLIVALVWLIAEKLADLYDRLVPPLRLLRLPHRPIAALAAWGDRGLPI